MDERKKDKNGVWYARYLPCRLFVVVVDEGSEGEVRLYTHTQQQQQKKREKKT
jgi:hypothetical protein